MNVLWSHFASKTFKDIYIYHKQFAGTRMVNRIKKRIFNSTKQFFKYSNSGQIEGTLKILEEEHRYLLVGNYKVIYKKVK